MQDFAGRQAAREGNERGGEETNATGACGSYVCSLHIGDRDGAFDLGQQKIERKGGGTWKIFFFLPFFFTFDLSYCSLIYLRDLLSHPIEKAYMHTYIHSCITVH